MAIMSGRTRTITLLIACAFGGLLVLLANACTARRAHERAQPQSPPYRLTDQDDRFLEDLSHRSFQFFAGRMNHQNGWFFHFVNLRTGAREWQSELSSIDTALLLGGVLTVRRCFEDDPGVVRAADTIYRRVDFQWMLAGHPGVLSHGWKPESGFLQGRWDHYCELMILYLLGIGSPTHPLPAASWRAWSRPVMTFQGYTFVSAGDPLFVHQYSHAWVDFRGRRESQAPY